MPDEPPIKPEELIREARERLDIPREELAELLGITLPHVWDLEGVDHEVSMTLSMTQLLRLSEALHLSPRRLAEVENIALPYRQPEELRDLIQHYCRERGLTVEAFSDEVGWDLDNFMAHPPAGFGEWNLECLKDVCSGLGINLGEFIPDTFRSVSTAES